MGFRLLFGDATAVNETLHEGVVFRDLLQVAVSEQVQPRIADVCEGKSAMHSKKTGECCAEPREFRMLYDGFRECAIGCNQGITQDLNRFAGAGKLSTIELGDVTSCESGSDVTPSVATHTVSDEILRTFDPKELFDRRVDFAAPAKPQEVSA